MNFKDCPRRPLSFFSQYGDAPELHTWCTPRLARCFTDGRVVKKEINCSSSGGSRGRTIEALRMLANGVE